MIQHLINVTKPFILFSEILADKVIFLNDHFMVHVYFCICIYMYVMTQVLLKI